MIMTQESYPIRTLPSNVLYVDSNYATYSDIFSPKDSNIYLVGNSNMLSVRQLLKNEKTISNILEEKLQKKVNNFSLVYSDLLNLYFIVKSHIPEYSTLILETNSLLIMHDFALLDTQLKLDDIDIEKIISVYEQILKIVQYKNIKCILVSSLPDREHRFSILSKYINFLSYEDRSIYDSDVYHLSNKGVDKYADMIFSLIKENKYIDSNTVIKEISGYEDYFYKEFNHRQNIAFKLLKLSSEYENFIHYLESIKDNSNNRTTKGLVCAVMNPFTLGHKYLLEYASKNVDILYLITCNSNNFYFKSKDRYEMMKLGIKDIPNIKLLEMNDVYANEIMFSDYVFKDIQSIKHISFRNMNTITINVICKILGITRRFFGEEPNNEVARSYMEQFKKDSNDSIICEIIPRKEIEGNTVSATYIRDLYKSNSYKEIKKYVPEKVYNYLLSVRSNYVC